MVQVGGGIEGGEERPGVFINQNHYLFSSLCSFHNEKNLYLNVASSSNTSTSPSTVSTGWIVGELDGALAGNVVTSIATGEFYSSEACKFIMKVSENSDIYILRELMKIIGLS